jgi:hypothetical protein
VEHTWEGATCESSSICSVCNEIKGDALGHTTKLGVCSRCNKEVRKISPVTILDWTYKIDSVGGVQWNYRIKNNTDKQIKYVTMKWECYNAVGDRIYDRITGKNYVRIKHTGPINAYSTTGHFKTTDKFYNYNLTRYVMTEVTVEYMNGTFESVGKYHDGLLG